MKGLKRQDGLTFIEVLVTIAIISMLMSVAYPAYDGYIKNSHTDALKEQLIDMSNDFDRVKRKTFTYKGVLKDGVFNTDIAPLTYPRNGIDVRFTIEVLDIEHTSYKIIATPVNNQGEDYGKISFGFLSGELVGKYDVDNDLSWSETWY